VAKGYCSRGAQILVTEERDLGTTWGVNAEEELKKVVGALYRGETASS
jgi:hypothetical protein